MQQNTDPAKFMTLAYLMFLRLLEALDTLSAQFPVQSATGMLLKHLVKSSPIFFHSSLEEMEASQLKPQKPEAYKRQPPHCTDEKMNRPEHTVKSSWKSKIRQNGCASPADMLIPSATREQQSQVCK